MRIPLIASIILFCSSMVLADPPTGMDRYIQVICSTPADQNDVSSVHDLVWQDAGGCWSDLDGNVSVQIDYGQVITLVLDVYDPGTGESLRWTTTGTIYDITHWTGYNTSGAGCAGDEIDHDEDNEGDVMLYNVRADLGNDMP